MEPYFDSRDGGTAVYRATNYALLLAESGILGMETGLRELTSIHLYWRRLEYDWVDSEPGVPWYKQVDATQVRTPAWFPIGSSHWWAEGTPKPSGHLPWNLFVEGVRAEVPLDVAHFTEVFGPPFEGNAVPRKVEMICRGICSDLNNEEAEDAQD
jgi:hypothetical protein